MRFCTMCKLFKPEIQFRKYKNGYADWCNNCRKEYKVVKHCTKGNIPYKTSNKYKNYIIKYYKENKSKFIVNSHNQRAKSRGCEGILSKEDWEEVLYESNYKCLKCGSTEKLTLDHIIPLSKGGKNIKENIQVLCWECNKRKHTKTKDYRKHFIKENNVILKT